RDLQEDKPQVFDAVKTVMTTLEALAAFTPTLKFNERAADNMLKGGFLEATVMAEYLVEKGLPFRLAHEASGELVGIAEERDCDLKDISLSEMKKVCSKFSNDIFKRLDPKLAVKHYKSASSAGTKEVAKSLVRWKKRLK
ncbi:MAG: argininosuccinate lyase, partial [Planctomycetota bacterium]